MAKGLRACPVCPSCGSKKFRVVENNNSSKVAIVECRSCSRRLSI